MIIEKVKRNIMQPHVQKEALKPWLSSLKQIMQGTRVIIKLIIYKNVSLERIVKRIYHNKRHAFRTFGI